jgi:hypothetical protein
MNVLARSFWLLERVPGRFEASVLLPSFPSAAGGGAKSNPWLPMSCGFAWHISNNAARAPNPHSKAQD